MTFARELVKLHPHIMSYEEDEELEDQDEELEEEEELVDPGLELDEGDVTLQPDITRKERQASSISAPSFADQAVLLALSYENSCSPVLRASAMSIIESLEE